MNKNQKKWLVILIVIIIVLALGLGLKKKVHVSVFSEFFNLNITYYTINILIYFLIINFNNYIIFCILFY